ncbi:MAG: enoyl-CoA hydratase/isomerase family protein [Gammaproteobacteria bacterium]|nr:enoyl-CoA hydratase/isomerase family protein [Gammaproteobacteria bacterium]
MAAYGEFTDLKVSLENYVAVAEIQRPPNNFFDAVLINAIADAFEALDADTNCRAIVLAAAGKNFCAGADFSAPSRQGQSNTNAGDLYRQAVRLFRTRKPIVGAIQGAAVGGGLGLALVPDFRVACEEARFSANFSRLGFHPGFGLTVTLPELIGENAANLMFYTGRRVKGAEAFRMGLADLLVPLEQVRSAAIEMATEIATSAPLAVESVRATMRVGLADRIAIATDHELAEQTWLRGTEDFKEGIAAMAERRTPDFKGN